ncbi:LysR family transcriptional regulator [Pyramidobacter sp. SM-530-WT-4B]|uniref:LysR family transcriptional regulator n=1 Tax=Pyramidobacter porci TaxID=2605789 RepID=A0A6L5YBK1_9BACT|nr:LysR family transcriptional regulator [Pyramidobacter porci]MST55428.1 LysR family transcriptional regulator [Pyramidobacter porci]
MTNNQIKYIIEAARAGSINQAAQNLFIAQSAVSNAIINVENEFGHRIFNRSPKGVRLTSFGRMFLAHIMPINEQLNQLYAMQNHSPRMSLSKTLRIISNGFFYISSVIARVASTMEADNIRILIKEDYSGDMVDSITNRIVDFGIVRLWSCYRKNTLAFYNLRKLVWRPLCKMRVGVDIGEKNPLYHVAGDEVEPAQLQNFPQILQESLDSGPYSDILDRLHLPVSKIRYIVDSRAAQYELLELTDGYTLNSGHVDVPYGENSSVLDICKRRFLALKDCPITSDIGLLTNANTALSDDGMTFVQGLQAYLSAN